MSADSPNDLELALKKRARRRLVGAIALVLFMVIVLPRVLQDRAALAPQETIKISMQEDAANQQHEPIAANVTSAESQAEVTAAEAPINTESPIVSEMDNPVQTENTKGSNDTKEMAGIKKPESKTPDIKKNEVKPSDAKSTEVKSPANSAESFTIQVGVFSDMANVKQLQARLKQAGLDSSTEKITTPKGEKIRLRAGRFSSRQEAAYALTKLQAADLSGMVISDSK